MRSATTPKGGSFVVTLDSYNDNVPMSDPEIFKVHRIITQILQVSGIGQQISRIKQKAESHHEYLDPARLTPIGPILSPRLLASVQSDSEVDKEHQSTRRNEDAKMDDETNDGSGDLTPTGPHLAQLFLTSVRIDNGGWGLTLGYWARQIMDCKD